MSRNGSGDYSLPQASFTAGTTIESAKVNSNFSDIAAALTASLAKDGQTTPTANLPMGGFKHTGVANATARTHYAAAGQIADNSIGYAADTGSADACAIAPAPGISAYAVGQRFTFKVASSNATTAPTLAVNSLTAGTIKWPNGAALRAGDLPANALVEVVVSAVSTGTPTYHLQSVAIPPLPASYLRSYLAGLTLSTAGSSSTFGIAVGEAQDSTNAAMMVLGSAYTKTTSAWAVGSGNGALDTGSIANSTWYHVYLIQRSDTGVVDVLVSTSASSPTMPTNYDRKRRIGAMKTDGSAQWVQFIQNGDQFKWVTWSYDYSGTSGSTSRQNLTLNVPTGVVVFPILLAQNATGALGGDLLLLTSLDETDSAPAVSLVHCYAAGSAGTPGNPAEITSLHTDTSGRIGRRSHVTDSAVDIRTMGWVDTRGRFD
jgi:hypothetical protein